MGRQWGTSPIDSCHHEHEIFEIRVMQTHRALVTTIKALSAGKIDHDFKHGPSGPHSKPAQHSRTGHACTDPNNLTWILDSGASSIFTPYCNVLEEPTSCSIKVSGSDSSSPCMTCEAKGKWGPFSNVMYVPKIAYCLLGLRPLEKLGYKVDFINREITKDGQPAWKINYDESLKLFKSKRSVVQA